MVEQQHQYGNSSRPNSDQGSPALRGEGGTRSQNTRKIDAIAGVTGSQAAAIRAMGGGTGQGPRDRRNDDLNQLRSQEQENINRLRIQNEKLKVELRLLTGKLENFVEKTRLQKKKLAFPGADGERDEVISVKETELKNVQQKVQFYKKEIENMRRQLEGSYNIQKIVALEDEQKDKERILRELQEESESLLKVQREQEKALQKLQTHGEYDSKIGQLSHELRSSKDHLRRLQQKHREDEKSMKTQHETLVLLEDKCRKMRQLIKEKKREKLAYKQHEVKTKKLTHPDGSNYTKEDLEQLQLKLSEKEKEQASDERRLKQEIGKSEGSVKNLTDQLGGLQGTLKQQDHQYRMNEIKIREMRRQLPARVLKPLDQKFSQLMTKLERQKVAKLPPTIPKLTKHRNLVRSSSRKSIPDKEEQSKQFQPTRNTPPPQVIQTSQIKAENEKEAPINIQNTKQTVGDDFQQYTLDKDDSKKIPEEQQQKNNPIQKVEESEGDENYTMIQDEVGSLIEGSAHKQDKPLTSTNQNNNQNQSLQPKQQEEEIEEDIEGIYTNMAA